MRQHRCFYFIMKVCLIVFYFESQNCFKSLQMTAGTVVSVSVLYFQGYFTDVSKTLRESVFDVNSDVSFIRHIKNKFPFSTIFLKS